MGQKTKLTTEHFIMNARAAHGDRYDYSRVEYKGARNKVEIVCPVHGQFWQIPWAHNNGYGCVECGAIKGGKAKHTNASFIEQARAVHGDKYDYSRVDYQASKTPVEVICPEHGPFFPTPNNHVSHKSGCPACSGMAPTTEETFLQRARAAHGDKYDYSRVEYRGVQKNVEIVCPEHGAFWQLPMSHTQGRGCPECGIIKFSTAQRLSLDEFVSRARDAHGDKYDYSRVQYDGASKKVEILCPEHGLFWQIAHDHLERYGCPACAGVSLVTRDGFISRARSAHGDRYDYNLVNYTRYKIDVEVLCRVHGTFWQSPKEHANGHGCPSCARESTTSDGERAIADWVASLGPHVVRNDRLALEGFEIDILVPEAKLGIEFNGAYWHSDAKLQHPRFHELKAARAEKQGIRLITVWDFDWANKRGIVQSNILHALGMNGGDRHDARKCQLAVVQSAEACAFLDATHLQGAPQRSNLHFGLRYNGKMVACLSMSRSGNRRKATEDGEWELTRYATAGLVRGGASRLLAGFVREYHPKTIWSFSDRQHFSGALYRALGFVEDGHLHADYRVMHQPPTGRIWHKSAWQRRHIPDRLKELGINEPFDPETDPRTERDMQTLAGVVRIMDAGKIRWKWTHPA